MSASLTWLKLLPLEIKETTVRYKPTQDLSGELNKVGTLPDELIKMWNLSMELKRNAEEKELEAKYIMDENKSEYDARVNELNRKSAALMDLFWIAVNDEFHLWDKPKVGIIKDFVVVWIDKTDEMPPMFRIFGE